MSFFSTVWGFLNPTRKEPSSCDDLPFVDTNEERRGADPKKPREESKSCTELVALLHNARGTPDEAEVVREVMDQVPGRTEFEPARIACADILASRGDERSALRILEGCSSTGALVLASDLYAATGQLPRAVSAIERVLARDLGASGALERHRRWTAILGYEKPPLRPSQDATVVLGGGPKSPYRILREVARGGSAAVYEAMDEALGRRVALKVYHGRGQARAIEQEARAIVDLAGPGVLRVFDADPSEGWLSLEWIPVGSFRDILEQRPSFANAGPLGGSPRAMLQPAKAWVEPLSRALRRIHQRGIVHADIKPANIFLRRSKDPVIGDFGIAQPQGSKAAGGSVGYLSPERLGGRPLHPSDDVYGFGRILEDVLEQGPPMGADAEYLGTLARLCMSSEGTRPADGAALVACLCQVAPLGWGTTGPTSPRNPSSSPGTTGPAH